MWWAWHPLHGPTPAWPTRPTGSAASTGRSAAERSVVPAATEPATEPGAAAITAPRAIDAGVVTTALVVSAAIHFTIAGITFSTVTAATTRCYPAGRAAIRRICANMNSDVSTGGPMGGPVGMLIVPKLSSSPSPGVCAV